MDTSELLEKVRKLEIRTKGLTKDVFSGDYHSAFKGRGMSFSEVREYHYGDDVRNIDWNVTARSGTPHIKIYEEERELTVMLLIDKSASAFYGTQTRMRQDLITEIAALIAFSAISNNDKVGAVLFSDRIEQYIPPAKGKKNILRIIRELINSAPSGTATDIGAALKYLTNVQKKRCICFILSDFIDERYLSSLQIAAGKHDIIGMMLYDTTESSLPAAGLIQVQDRESGKILMLDTDSVLVRESWKDNFTSRSLYFDHAFKRSGADMIMMNLDEDYLKELHRFFKRRAK